MTTFEPKISGFEGLEADLDKLGRLDNQKVWVILTPAAEAIKEAMKDKIKTSFQQHTAKLYDSVEIFPKVGDFAYMLIYPYGVHHKYNARLKTKVYKRSKHGRTYTTGGKPKNASANDVAFVLEYGDDKHKAMSWPFPRATLTDGRAAGWIFSGRHGAFSASCASISTKTFPARGTGK